MLLLQQTEGSDRYRCRDIKISRYREVVGTEYARELILK